MEATSRALGTGEDRAPEHPPIRRRGALYALLGAFGASLLLMLSLSSAALGWLHRAIGETSSAPAYLADGSFASSWRADDAALAHECGLPIHLEIEITEALHLRPRGVDGPIVPSRVSGTALARCSVRQDGGSPADAELVYDERVVFALRGGFESSVWLDASFLPVDLGRWPALDTLYVRGVPYHRE